MRFLGMAGYYRKFCNNFSSMSAPLTDLLKKIVSLFGMKFVKIPLKTLLKAMLSSAPVHLTPNLGKPCKLCVDDSDG